MNDYRDAIRHLYGLTRFGIKLGLDNTRRLAARAGNPQERLRFIHVAGTNGKGTTCAMLDSIYARSNLKVGLYTSPHLVSFRERIQVMREPIPPAATVRLIGELRSLAESDAELNPSFFEFVTVLALLWFAEQECDLVVLETGLGGRYDSTNIVTPLASVITRIGLDHQNILGNTLAEIAAEKAGIIKPGVPVFSAEQEPAAASVIERTARELRAPLAFPTPCPELTANVPGEHNRRNAELAVLVARRLSDRIAIQEERLAEALTGYSWPGRLQLLERNRQRIVLDGAHNIDGFRALLAGLAELLPKEKPALILGLLGDKDEAAIAEEIQGRFRTVLIVPVASKRAANPETLAASFRGKAARDLPTALQALAEEPSVVIAGSFYLIGEALELLGALPPGMASERELNEWGR